MLAYPQEGSEDIKDEAHSTFKWTIKGSYDVRELMINGGDPIRKNVDLPLVRRNVGR